MTQTTGSHRTSIARKCGRLLLACGLGWLTVTSLFNSNLLLAQTYTESTIDPVEAPQPLPQPIVVEEPGVVEVAPFPSTAPAEAMATEPVAPAPLEAVEPIVPAAPLPAIGRSPVSRQALELAPAESLATEPVPSHQATNTDPQYIDPTDYRIGATKTYEAPNAVVLSERSTGCSLVLRAGQGVPSGLCGASAPESGYTAAYSSRYSGGYGRNWQANSPGYSRGGISPISVGPLTVGPEGVRMGVPQGYYNVTARPVGRLGNNNTRLLFPLSLPAPITSLFGWRVHPITGDSRFHSGADLGAPMGTPVLAAYAGEVAIADFMDGYGLTVVLNHNKNTQETLYAHLSEIFVRPGEQVKQGTVIGRVGSTGNSTGPHLHFEVRQLTEAGWVALDPGAQLEYAVAQLIKALQVAQKSNSTPS